MVAIDQGPQLIDLIWIRMLI